jgi:hypothetical protein
MQIRVKTIVAGVVIFVVAIFLADIVMPPKPTTPMCAGVAMRPGDTCTHTSQTSSYDNTYDEESRSDSYDQNYWLVVIIFAVLFTGWKVGEHWYVRNKKAKLTHGSTHTADIE